MSNVFHETKCGMLHLVDDGDDFGAVDDFGLESAAVERDDGGGDGGFDEAGVHVGGGL